ncbi:MAG: hypothetical protein KME22_03910 [Hassallia sp. WJT32-NPBG1]|jgi:GTP-binding protein EngB required for normal cell division|nr:hypothetical protein [Spirirestis rafaelensis WJT71-NPBG6]MBW4606377.1 hypothetical protein [Hassallia sp. WJT32-NPBG1]
MKTEDAMLASTLAEIAIAAEILATKIDSLKKLDTAGFNKLNDLVYEDCDLALNDGINVLYSVMYVLNQPN